MIKNTILLKLALLGSLTAGLQAEYIRDDNKNIVLDSASGLMWQDDSDATTITKTWTEAIAYCEEKELGGYSDWRLPNQNELYNLADRSKANRAISPVFINIVLGSYWTSTALAGDTSGASWFVYFGDGSDYWSNKTNSNYVRCVRGGM